MLQKCHALFRLEEKFSLLRKEKMQLTYLLIANWDITKAINKCGQEIISTLQWHTMHICIHETITHNILEIITNGSTKAKLLEN